MSDGFGMYGERKQELLNQSVSENQRLEILEQEKYSLLLQLKTQTQSNETLAADVEYFVKENKDLQKKLSILEKEVSILKQRNDNSLKEKQDFEKTQEDLQQENSTLKKRVNVLEQQIKNYQDTEIANESIKLEETPNVAEYEFKIKNLEDVIKELNDGLESSKQTEKRLISMIHELEGTVTDLNKELSFELQRNKEHQESIEELRCENEVLKLNQLDENKRGNSMFAELDDRRKHVEKIFKELQQKHINLTKNYDDKDKELKRIQGKIALFSSRSSKDYHEERTERLSRLLSEANSERHDLLHKLERAERLLAEHKTIHCLKPGDQYNYLRRLYEEAEERKKIVEGENFAERSKVLDLSERMVILNQKIFDARKKLDEAQCENLKLKLQIKDLTAEPEVCEPEPTPNIEFLPGFENKPKSRTEKENTNPDDYIPGEYLMTENGFVEVSKPRLTNRARFRKYFEEKARAEEEAKVSPEEGVLKEANSPDTQQAPVPIELATVELESGSGNDAIARSSFKREKKQVQCNQQ